MSQPTVLEFKLPESQHHVLELLREVFANDMSVAREHGRRAQEAERIARTKLTNAAERMLNESQADKLPEGKVPAGSQLQVDFDAKTISMRTPPEPTPVKQEKKGKVTKLKQGETKPE